MSGIHPVGDLLARMEKHWPEAALPEAQMVIALVRFGEIIRKRTDEVLERHGLTAAAFEVLVSLRALPEPRQMTPTALYRSTLLTSGGTTKVLIELERRGAVERLANPEDGRSRIVQLTAAGAELAERVTAEVNEIDRSHFDLVRQEMDLEDLKAQVLRMVALTEQAAPD